jgi:hypothetical protein
MCSSMQAACRGRRPWWRGARHAPRTGHGRTSPSLSTPNLSAAHIDRDDDAAVDVARGVASCRKASTVYAAADRSLQTGAARTRGSAVRVAGRACRGCRTSFSTHAPRRIPRLAPHEVGRQGHALRRSIRRELRRRAWSGVISRTSAASRSARADSVLPGGDFSSRERTR